MTPDPFPSEPIPGPDPGACPDCGGWRKAGVIHNCTPDLFPNELVEAAARAFHENYERLAPDYGYKTREASAVAWEGVPEKNRSLMLATVAAVLPLIEQRVIDRLAREAGENPYRDLSMPLLSEACKIEAEVWDAGAACGVAAERERTAAMQRAIDATLTAWHASGYVGGPSEAEAYRIMGEQLGPFQTHEKGAALSSPAEPDTEASNE